jgi:predicted P-loop ATPase
MQVEQQQPKSVVEYLGGLAWDGVPRIDRWLIDLAGADDTEHVRKASRALLVAAVRRARKPGCRFEQLVVINGPQGCGKSRALELLAVEGAWFSHDLPIHGSSRDLMEATSGKWIVEAGELLCVTSADAAALKAYLSRTHDEARPAYQREVTRSPRQFVVVGTTSAAEYLSDATSNRRIVPISVRHFDLAKLAEIRDQLWAESAIAEATGEAIYIALATSNAPSA